MLTNVKFDSHEYSNEIINKSVSDILNENKLLSLATAKIVERPWVNHCYFAFDEEMKLYILTYPKSEHMDNISNNPNVAVSIADSTQDSDGYKRGIQLVGVCRVVDEVELQSCIDIYTSRFPWFRKYITKPKDFERSSLDSRFYIIEPNEIKIFDEVIFGEETWVHVKIN